MERVEPPRGYVLDDKDAVAKIIAVEADLLRSDGMDPAWPGFAKTADTADEEQ